MTQLNLFLEVLDTVTRLLDFGADSKTTYEARSIIDSLVADFEENQGIEIEDESVGDEVELTPLESMLIKIATKERTTPQELKDYFLVTEHFQVVKHHHIENEIFFRGSPPLKKECTPEVAKLRVGIFSILNDLIKAGLTSCTMHEAHMNLDALLAEHEQIQRGIEDYEMETLRHFYSNRGGKTYGAI